MEEAKKMVTLKDKEKFLMYIHGEPQYVYGEDDVKAAVFGYVYILDCWNRQDCGTGYDEDKLYDICEKYNLDLNQIVKQDISHQELVESIFGEFK